VIVVGGNKEEGPISFSRDSLDAVRAVKDVRDERLSPEPEEELVPVHEIHAVFSTKLLMCASEEKGEDHSQNESG